MSEDAFEELQRFVRFEEADGASLRRLHTVVSPQFQAIAGRFHERLWGLPGTRVVVADEAQVARLKEALVGWLDRLLCGPWDAEHRARGARIGLRHVEIRLPQRYMFAAMHDLRIDLIASAEAAFPASSELRERVVKAVDKILALELALMLDSYVDAHEAEVRDAERFESAAEHRRLVDRTRKAERLASLGTMAAGLAHEIRNPLNAAQLQMHLLAKRLAKPEGADLEGVKAASQLVGAELARLAKLVDDVLAFARPSPLRRVAVDLCEVAKSVAALTKVEAAAQGVEVELRCEVRTRGLLDAERVKQVLHNLVRNAVDSCATRGSGRVVISIDQAPGTVFMHVEDDGPGINHADTPVFEPFFTTKAEGTGLGLALAHRIVTDHGGTLTFESADGRTVFTVSLPDGPGS